MKNLFVVLAIAASTFLVFSSCKEKPEALSQPTGDVFSLDSAKHSIAKQNAAFQLAFEKSDSVGLANLFTTDGKMMMPGAPSIVGRSAIEKVVAGFMKMNLKRVAQTIDVWGNNDLIAEEGTASLFDQKGNELDHAKYLVVWKKEDGEWRLFRDMWNTDLAPKPSK